MNAVATQTFIPVCCVCGLARDHEATGDGPGREQWSDFDDYLTRHGLHGADYRLTHAYCPICLRQYVPLKKKSARGRAPSGPGEADLATVIARIIADTGECDLDTLVRTCPQLTWNQIFLEVDRLSRAGEVCLTLSAPGHYRVSLPDRQIPALAG